MLIELIIMSGIYYVHNKLNIFKKMTKDNKYGTYIDANGTHRQSNTLTPVNYTTNIYGERVIENAKNGQTITNIDVVEAKKNKTDAIQNNNAFYVRSYGGGDRKHKLGNDDIYGVRYCKVDNDTKYYVKRKVQYVDDNEKLIGEFYMDMDYNIIEPCESLIDFDYKLYGYCRYDLYDKIKSLCNINNSSELWKDTVKGEHSIIRLGNISYNEFSKNHRKFVNLNKK